MNTDIQALNSLDETLYQIGTPVIPIEYSKLTNEAEQKKAFLTGAIRNPCFAYIPLKYDPAEVEKRLSAVQIPSGELASLFEKKLTDILLQNRICAHRGNEKIVREATTAMHGQPDELLVAYAGNILQTVQPKEDAKTIPASTAKQAFENAFADWNLPDWKATLVPGTSAANVNSAKKEIRVGQDRIYATKDIDRLILHEIEVYVIRAANGYEQPLKIFATGLVGYLPTEEGLTSFFEKQTGMMDEELIRKYAARVIAVDSVCKGLDFR